MSIDTTTPKKFSVKLIVGLGLLTLLLICVVLLVVISPQFKVAFGPVRITDVYMTTGFDDQGQPLAPINRFSPDEPRIYCYVEVSSPKSIYVKLKWIQENIVVLEQGELVYGWKMFSVEPLLGGVFGEGDYKVEIYLADTLVETVEFSVKR